MPNMQEKKMAEQGYNYLDGPIYSMAEIIETRIENLEKTIPPSVHSRNRKKSKKSTKKRTAVTFGDCKDKDLDQGHKEKK